jgi:gas vesicle protein
MHDDGSSHFLEGLVLGGLVGAALGIFFAPHTGDKTRKTLKKKLKEMDLDQIVARFTKAFESGKKEAKKLARRTKK